MQEFEARIWFENDKNNQMITLDIEADSKAEVEEILKMAEQNKGDITEHDFKDKCPKCGSEDLHYDTIEPVEDQMVQIINCIGCRLRFKTWTRTHWVYEIENGEIL